MGIQEDEDTRRSSPIRIPERALFETDHKFSEVDRVWRGVLLLAKHAGVNLVALGEKIEDLIQEDPHQEILGFLIAKFGEKYDTDVHQVDYDTGTSLYYIALANRHGKSKARPLVATRNGITYNLDELRHIDPPQSSELVRNIMGWLNTPAKKTNDTAPSSPPKTIEVEPHVQALIRQYQTEGMSQTLIEYFLMWQYDKTRFLELYRLNPNDPDMNLIMDAAAERSRKKLAKKIT